MVPDFQVFQKNGVKAFYGLKIQIKSKTALSYTWTANFWKKNLLTLDVFLL